MFDTWTPAVFSVMNSSSPIWRFVRPRATSARTSRSRAVSPNLAASSTTAGPGSAGAVGLVGDRQSRPRHERRGLPLEGQGAERGRRLERERDRAAARRRSPSSAMAASASRHRAYAAG